MQLFQSVMIKKRPVPLRKLAVNVEKSTLPYLLTNS
nr:MAG TPA: hypothetical protein [Caudoviricetes sp.]